MRINDFTLLDVIHSDVIGISISKNEVKSLDFQKIDTVMELMKNAGKEAANKLYLSFEGYDNLRQEIYEISEIRKWMRRFAKKHPYFLYFLEKEKTESHIYLLATLCQLEKLSFEYEPYSENEYMKKDYDLSNMAKKDLELVMIEELKLYLVNAIKQTCENFHDQKSETYVLSFLTNIKIL